VAHTPPYGSTPCPNCGNPNRYGARFCDACGTLLSSGFGSQPLRDSELKYITVLFGDIVGSTEMVAGRSPDEAQSILTPAVKAMVETVQIFGGTLNQVLGDGVMALFGAPLSQEDHALRACCAAFSMHEAVAVAHSPVRLRVGLASGLTLLSTPGQGTAGAYPAFAETRSILPRACKRWRIQERHSAPRARGCSLAPLSSSSRSGPARFVVLAYSKTCSHRSASANAPFASIDRLRAA